MGEQVGLLYYVDEQYVAVPNTTEGLRLFRRLSDGLYYVKRSDNTLELFSVGLGLGTTREIYKANLTQTGVLAPVATVLENTLGAVVWTYDAVGSYVATLAGAFPDATKVSTMISKQFLNSDTGGVYINREFAFGVIDANSLYLFTETNGVPSDDVLLNVTVEVNVYA